MAVDLDVGFTVFGDTAPASRELAKFQRQVTKSDKRLEKFNKTLNVVARERQRKFTAAIRGTSVALAGLGVALLKTAKTAGVYDRQIRVAGILTGNTGEQFAEFDAEVKKVSSDLAVLPVQVAKAGQAVGRLGFRGAAAINVLRSSVTLAAASVGKLTSEKAAGAVAGALRAFGKTGKDAMVAADALTNAVNRSRLEWDKLPLAIGTASGFAAAFGANLNEMLAITGGVQDILGRTERSATGVRNIFRDLASETTIAKLAQRGLKLEVVDASGNFRKIIPILRDLFEQTEKMTQAQRQQTLQSTFSQEASAALFSLQNRLVSGFRDMNGELVTGIKGLQMFADSMGETGSTMTLAQEKLKGFAGAMDLLKTEGTLLAIEIGAALSTTLVPALKFVTGLITKLKDAFANTSPVVKTIIGVFGAAAIVLGILGGVLLAASLVMGGWTFITGAATAATLAFLASLGPIVIAIGAIVGLVTVFWNTIKKIYALALRFRRFIGFGGPAEEEQALIDELEGKMTDPETGERVDISSVPTGAQAIQAGAADKPPATREQQVKKAFAGGGTLEEQIERAMKVMRRTEKEASAGKGGEAGDINVTMEMDSLKVGTAVIAGQQKEARRTFRRMPTSVT